jgi:hypothetical protein
MADHTEELAGQPAIFADGASAPPVTSFAACKSFYRSVDATKAHDMTLAGDASFNGGIFLAAAAVDRAFDEDINTSATIIPTVEILGPITQSRAQ